MVTLDVPHNKSLVTVALGVIPCFFAKYLSCLTVRLFKYSFEARFRCVFGLSIFFTRLLCVFIRWHVGHKAAPFLMVVFPEADHSLRWSNSIALGSSFLWHMAHLLSCW